MTKADVVNRIAEQTGIPRLEVLKTVESFVKVMKNSMIEGNNVYIRGFGSFIIKKLNCAPRLQIISRRQILVSRS